MKRVSFLLLSVVILTIVAVVFLGQANQAAQAAQVGQKKWPSAPPRNGAIKLFETDQVIVWDDRQATEHFLHKHARDFIALTIEAGASQTINEAGTVTSGRGGGAARTPPRAHGNGIDAVDAHIVKAGTGPHSEIALDPKKRRRQIWIELKGTEPADCKNWSSDPACK